MINLKTLIDLFIRPRNKRDSNTLVRNRTIVSLNLGAIVVFAILINYILTIPSLIFNLGFVLLIVSLYFEVYGNRVLFHRNCDGLLQYINILFFSTGCRKRNAQHTNHFRP